MLDITVKLNGLNPEEQMALLGEMHNQMMQARVDAYQRGFEVIHTELCKITRLIHEKQTELFAQHPELIFMVIKK